jgi:hypothetical protein
MYRIVYYLLGCLLFYANLCHQRDVLATLLQVIYLESIATTQAHIQYRKQL